MKKFLWLCLLLPALASAAIDVYQFDKPQQEQRFRELTEQLRCPKCQNQSISDSDADIARDMRAQVAKMIRDGQSNEQIVSYFTDRYGDFVNYKPPLNTQTLILWVGPGVVFVIGLTMVLVQIRRARGLVQEKDQDA